MREEEREGRSNIGSFVHREQKEEDYLINVFAFPDKLFHRPFGQHAEFRCDETYFASTSPYDGRCTAVRNEFLEFLPDVYHSFGLRRG